MKKDEPDIFADALASQIDAIRRAAFDEAIGIVRDNFPITDGKDLEETLDELRVARDETNKPRSDKGKHHRVAGVLQEDVDEAEN